MHDLSHLADDGSRAGGGSEVARAMKRVSLRPIPRGIAMIIAELWEVRAHVDIFCLLSLLEAGGFDVAAERDGMDAMFAHLARDEWAPATDEAARRMCLVSQTPRATARDLAGDVILRKGGKNNTFSRGRIRRSLRNMFVRAGFPLDAPIAPTHPSRPSAATT